MSSEAVPPAAGGTSGSEGQEDASSDATPGTAVASIENTGDAAAAASSSSSSTANSSSSSSTTTDSDIMCGACGQILKRDAHEYCVRCGIRLDCPERVWDAAMCGNSKHDTPRIARVRQEMLGTMVKVHIEDGRIFVGRFLAFDKHRSMILSECREYRRVKPLPDGPEKEEKRNAGLILIGGKFIKSVHWAKITEEGKQKLKEEEEERRRKQEAEEKELAEEQRAQQQADELV